MELAKNVKTWKQREARMDMEATTNDNDATDADMHELILRATQRQSAVMMAVCSRI